MTRHVAWMGLSVDHLYEGCPGRLRGLAQLRRYGHDKQCVDLVDPEGTDICGWCVRVWRSHQKAGIE